jgi:hypothetical protein
MDAQRQPNEDVEDNTRNGDDEHHCSSSSGGSN